MLSLWMLYLMGLLESSELKSDKPSLSTIGLLDAARDAMARAGEYPPEYQSLPHQLQKARLASEVAMLIRGKNKPRRTGKYDTTGCGA